VFVLGSGRLGCMYVNHICDDLSQCIIDCNAWEADFGLHKHKAKHSIQFSEISLFSCGPGWGARVI